MASFKNEDWEAFHARAKAGLQGRAYIIVVDTKLRKIVKTFVPYAEQPSTTGDRETAVRVIESKKPAVSDVHPYRVGQHAVLADGGKARQRRRSHLLLAPAAMTSWSWKRPPNPRLWHFSDVYGFVPIAS